MHGLNGVVKLGDVVPKTIEDLKGWVIVSDGVLRWLGMDHAREGSCIHLKPAYQMSECFVSNGQQIARPRAVVPIDYLASAREVIVSATSVISIDTLDEIDKQTILGWIAGAEDVRKQMRAQRSGLVIPTGVRPQ